MTHGAHTSQAARQAISHLVVCVPMLQVFDAMRVSSGNSFCWETEVPRMLKGDYFPDFTAQMMLKVTAHMQCQQTYLHTRSQARSHLCLPKAP